MCTRFVGRQDSTLGTDIGGGVLWCLPGRGGKGENRDRECDQKKIG